MWRGRPSVIGGRVLRQEDVRRSCGAQDGVDEAGGGPAQAGITEALGGGRRSFGSTLRHHYFNDATGLAWARRWRRRPWHSCSGAQGAAAWPGRWRHDKAECSMAVFVRRRAERGAGSEEVGLCFGAQASRG
jgi:hypothetical protein